MTVPDTTTDTGYGRCDSTSDFTLQTLTGSIINDVAALKTALKNGNVVIRTSAAVL